MKNITRNAIPLLSGALFAAGLVLAGMTQPAKVVGFLDFTGVWDPSLGFVMAGAIAVHLLAYQLVPRLRRPLAAERFALPTRRDVDAPLLVGAALFGIGWGVSGFCPGPALTSTVTGARDALIFAGSMTAGMVLYGLYERRRAAPAPAHAAPQTTEATK